MQKSPIWDPLPSLASPFAGAVHKSVLRTVASSLFTSEASSDATAKYIFINELNTSGIQELLVKCCKVDLFIEVAT